jgi:transposase-like protein
MRESTQSVGQMEGLFGPDRLSEALRGKVREIILTLAEAELREVLAAMPYERKGERRGYRNGKRERWVSTGLGATAIELPRARVTEGGQEKEWQSGLIERYQRRARSVDSALLGCYLSGANGRRIRGALSPLLRCAPLSKRNLADYGSSSSFVYRLAPKVVEDGGGGFSLSGCHRLAGEDR